MNILIFIIILSILILVHEIGHFIAAKKSGIFVEEFGLGYPPRIFGKKIGETIYSLNWLPFGGFVKVYGEEYNQIKLKLRKRAFAYKKNWQKTLVLTAGVIGNFLLAWVIFSFLLVQGIPKPINKVIIDQVQKNSPAEKVGLKKNDTIIKFKKNNKNYIIKSIDQFVKITKTSAGQKINLIVLRNQKTIKISIVPRKKPLKNQGALGIVIRSYRIKKYPWYQAPFLGFVETSKVTLKIVQELSKGIIKLITFQKSQMEVTGPIGIAKYTNQAIKFGRNAVLEFTALLSLNLAVLNILPIPALDGGRLVFVIYEWVTKKRVNEKIERSLNLIGISVLIALLILVSISDIIKLFK